MGAASSDVGSPSTRTAQRRFGILCLLGYVALSWAVRFDMPGGQQIASLIYPLDTFSMYAGSSNEFLTYLLIRDRTGAAHHVMDFRSFDCTEPVTGSGAKCGDGRWFQYLHDDLTNYIRDHAGPGGEDVELVARTWQIRSGAAPVQTADCIIAHCRAAR